MLFPTPASLLVSLFSLLVGTGDVNIEKHNLQTSNSLEFELRHLHATSANHTAHIIFSDVISQKVVRSSALPSHNINASHNTTYTVKTRLVKIYKPPSFEAHARARSQSMRFGQSENLDWVEDKTMAPDVENREALLELAKMTNNAYVEPNDPAWYDIGPWNSVRLP